MTREEAVALLERYSNYEGMGIPNLAGCKEAMKVAVDALKEAFPELAESEDEKIRKAIIGIIKNSNVIDINVSHERMFAYLEKQAEQKQEKFPPYVTGFKGDPDPAGTSDLEEAAKEYASKTLCDPDDGPSTGLAKESFIAGAEWQKEQKPAEWQKEQKPAEWSEEDEKDMAHIIRILNDCYVYAKHDLSKTDHENLVNKLKSLRPSWKPSKEQMKALYDACCIAFEEERCFHPSLSRLYHDLRKL